MRSYYKSVCPKMSNLETIVRTLYHKPFLAIGKELHHFSNLNEPCLILALIIESWIKKMTKTSSGYDPEACFLCHVVNLLVLEAAVPMSPYCWHCSSIGRLPAPLRTAMGVWQGVVMYSLKFHQDPPCRTLSRPVGGPPLKRPYGCFRGSPLAGSAACGHLLSL
jgi:hypothetical protein